MDTFMRQQQEYLWVGGEGSSVVDGDQTPKGLR